MLLRLNRKIVSVANGRSMSLFKDVELVNAKGEKKKGDECVKNKVLALYFAVCISL